IRSLSTHHLPSGPRPISNDTEFKSGAPVRCAPIIGRSHAGFWLSLAPTFEKVGTKLDAQRLAGVVLVEATKHVYITPQSGLRERARAPLDVLGDLAPQPRPKPATGRLVNYRQP
ncbi:MAG: hypothetical protein AAFZ09_17455, partial [Pseudomonadota bacterium]